jgi:hypothetical protein
MPDFGFEAACREFQKNVVSGLVRRLMIPWAMRAGDRPRCRSPQTFSWATGEVARSAVKIFKNDDDGNVVSG